MAILTDAKARNIKATDKPIAHGGVPGLRLFPSKTKGSGRWELRYVSPVTKKRRDAGLGSYPAVSLAEARQKAEEMHELIARQIDPLDHAKSTVFFKSKAPPTFEYAMLETLKVRRLTWKNDQAATVRWLGRIQKHAAPLLALPVNTISPEHIKVILQPLWASKPDTARKLKTAINHVLNWSEAHDFIEHSPMPKALKQLGDVHKAPITHQPSMPYPLIPEFVEHHLLPALSVTQNLILFVILTAVRSANARYATWDQFDLKNKIWTIPPEAMKSKKHEGAQLEVPLSQGALIILEQMREMHPTLVFPSPRKGAVLSDMSTTSFLRARNAPSDIKDRLATLHGFRSSFKNWSLEKTTFSDELSEVALGHVVGSRVRRAYARTHQLDQRRELMEEWSNYVFQIHKNPISLGI